MKATVKGRYEPEKISAAATVMVPAGDLRLKASMTDATVVKGPSLNGLALSVEKPGAFVIDYNVPKKDVRFQFMNTIRVMEKPLSLTYMHFRGDNRTTLDSSVAFDPANKVSVNYVFGTNNCKVKYMYAHGVLRRTMFEPCYDLSKNAWDFAVSRKFESGDSMKATYHTVSKNLGLEWTQESKINGSFKATYHTASKNLGLEWTPESKINGSFKILASVNFTQQPLAPKLVAESTWNFEM